ncbi:hypothetical protein V4S35_15200 [Enterococcus cecorum]
MFSYEEGRAFDAWYTKKPEPIQENIGRELVEKSVISDEPIYKGNKVLIGSLTLVSSKMVPKR